MNENDHDQLFKELLQARLADFLRQAVPEWAAKLDLRNPEWLLQEQFLDPPTGRGREADLVARVAALEPVPPLHLRGGESCLVVIHIEVEGRPTSIPIRPRMFETYFALRRRYELPVLPIVLFTHVGRGGYGWDVYEEHLWGRTLLRYEYPYLGLPALNAAEAVHGDNLLAVALAGLM